MHGRLARGGLVAAVSAGALWLLAGSAMGCSCAAGADAREQLQHARGAVFGTVRAVRPLNDRPGRVMLSVHVERAFKGTDDDFIEVRTASDEAGCGLSLGPSPVGSNFSQFLYRGSDGVWETGLCLHVSRTELARAARPLPKPARGRAAVVVSGAFGPVRGIALGADGRPVGYARADGTVLDSAMCPGGQRFVESVATEGPRSRYELAVRALPSLQLVRRLRLPGVRTLYPLDLDCRDAQAREVLVLALAGRGRGAHGRLLSWRGPSLRRLRKIDLATGLIAGPRVYAIRSGRRRIQSISLASGRITSLPRLKGFVGAVAGDGAGRFAAEELVSLPRGETRSNLVTFDPGARGKRLHRRRLNGSDGAGNLVWTDAGRLVQKPTFRDVRVYDSKLRRVGTITGARDPGGVAVRGNTLYLVSEGRLRRARLPAGRARTVRRLPVSQIAILAATPRSSAAAAGARAVACSAWTRVRRVSL